MSRTQCDDSAFDFTPRATPVWRIARVENDCDLTPVEGAPKGAEYEDGDFA